MRVAVYYKNSDVRIEERPKPQIGPDEILVKVAASGICGSDVMEWYRIKKAPLVLGHEIVGEVSETGENVKKYKKGDRVFVSHHVPCNTCTYCLNDHHTACETLHTTNFDPGGFSEYVRIPQINVDRGTFLLPDEMTYNDGVFIEPLACVFRGQRIARLKPGQSVLIIGGGISGLLHLLLAKSSGAGRIIVSDINQYRLEMAKKLGAETVIHAEEFPAESIKVDLVIVCTGAMSAFNQALQSVERGGTILFFAPTDPGKDLPVPVNELWRNENTLLTSYANSPYDASVAIELIRSGRVPVSELITHELPLEEAEEGFKLVARADKSVKVILHP